MGYGIAFELKPVGSGYAEKILHAFGGKGDGDYPWSGFAEDATGALYGTALSGGTYGSGAIYKLTHSRKSYTESVIFSFQGYSDGSGPAGTPILTKAGVIYGATETGGLSGCHTSGPGGCGTVFALKPKAAAIRKPCCTSSKGRRTMARSRSEELFCAGARCSERRFTVARARIAKVAAAAFSASQCHNPSLPLRPARLERQ